MKTFLKHYLHLFVLYLALFLTNTAYVVYFVLFSIPYTLRYIISSFFWLIWNYVIPSRLQTYKFIERRLFFCFFVWRILDLWSIRTTIFFIFYLFLVVVLWSCFYIFLCRWTHGLYLVLTLQGMNSWPCMFLFLWLCLFGSTFLELRRLLRHYLLVYVIYNDNEDDWQDPDPITLELDLSKIPISFPSKRIYLHGSIPVETPFR